MKQTESKTCSTNEAARKSESTKGPESSGLLSNILLDLHSTFGNQGVRRLVHSGIVQAKLRIGQPGDKYEEEADRVADRVMRMPARAIQKKPG